jgi:predicted RNase H-like HicB family nuclease
MEMQAVLKLTGQVSYDDVAGCWESYCPELNVYSAANSEEQARDALASAVNMTLTSYYRHGRLDEFLKKQEFTPVPRLGHDDRIHDELCEPFVMSTGGEDAIRPHAAAV